MQKISKNNWIGWINLCDFIKEELHYSQNQELTKKMVINIKELLSYICSRTEEEITYSELLVLFKQCKVDIERMILKENITDDEKINIACQTVKNYFQKIFGFEKDDIYKIPYFTEPCTAFVQFSSRIDGNVYQKFQEKIDTLKEKMNTDNYREFTISGVVNSFILAFAEGLIDFKYDDDKVWMYCESGIVGAEDTCKLSE